VKVCTFCAQPGHRLFFLHDGGREQKSAVAIAPLITFNTSFNTSMQASLATPHRLSHDVATEITCSKSTSLAT